MTIRFSRDTEPEFTERSPAFDLFGDEFLSESFEPGSAQVSDAEPNVASDSSVYVPEYYEENYAYPLVVWVERGQTALQGLQHVMPVISNRNYFGLSFDVDSLALEAEFNREEGSPCDTADLADCLRDQIRQLRRKFHIHSERIFLAGFGEGGTIAVELGLSRPEWFAGIVSLAGRLPNSPRLLHRYADLRGKRVLLGAGSRDRKTPLRETVRLSRLLHAAGMKVCTRIHETGHQITRTMLTDIDRWIMQEIYHPQPVS